MRILHHSVTALLLSVVTSSVVAAQDIDSPYRFVDPGQHVNIFAGVIETDPGTLDLGPESGTVFGLRYGIRLSGPFTVEVAAAAFPTTRMIQDTVIVEGDTTRVPTGFGSDLTLGIATVDLRFDITGPRTWHRLMPFTLLGVGGAFVITEDDDADVAVDPDVRYDFGTRLVGELGVGFEWFPVDRITARFDARNVLWQIEVPTGLQTLDAPTEEWVQNFLLSAGVSVRF